MRLCALSGGAYIQNMLYGHEARGRQKLQMLIDLSQKQNELTALVEKQKLKLAEQQKLLDETTSNGVNKMKDIIRMFLKMQDSIELMFEEHFQGNFQINFFVRPKNLSNGTVCLYCLWRKEFVIF